MFNKFVNDWHVSTTWEKIKLILILFLVLLFGGLAIYYLEIGTSDGLNAQKLLISYLFFTIMTLVCRINLVPKARK